MPLVQTGSVSAGIILVLFLATYEMTDEIHELDPWSLYQMVVQLHPWHVSQDIFFSCNMDSNWVLHVISTCEEWGGSPHQQGASLGTSWVSYTSTQFWHIYTETASGCADHRLLYTPLPHLRMPGASQVVTCASDPLVTNYRFQQSLPTQDAKCKSRLWPVLLTDWVIHQRFSRLPSWVWLICQSGSQNSGKHLLTRLLVYDKKNVTQELADERDGQGGGAPWTCHSLWIFKCSPTWKNSEPFWIFMKVHYIGMSD